MRTAIADAGPLVAYFDRSERHHGWAVAQVTNLQPPLLVCEPVVAETMYLLGAVARAQDALLALLENGALKIAFRVDEHLHELRNLCRKYRDQPMSLADACIVRMAELYDRHSIFTLDSDFLVYRKHGRAPLALIQPAS
jgi:predicted nucleic acid-binding protein